MLLLLLLLLPGLLLPLLFPLIALRLVLRQNRGAEIPQASKQAEARRRLVRNARKFKRPKISTGMSNIPRVLGGGSMVRRVFQS